MVNVVVVGGANVDVVARPRARAEQATSTPGTVTVTAGGVARNIAEVLARLGTPVRLVSAVGGDQHGDLVVEASTQAGVDLTHVRQVAGSTGAYVALLDVDGELVGAVSDMADCDLAPDDLDPAMLAEADLVVVDGNLAPATLARALDLAGSVPVALDPVSVPKAARLREVLHGRRLFLVSAGEAELAALGDVDAELVWERRGPDGSTLTGAAGTVDHPALLVEDVVDVTGAGDAMLGAFLHAWLGGATPAEAAAYGHAAAALTVASAHTVRPDLTDTLVRSLL
ncbi:PfkB family carbohydrate kinase [Nocardioides rubriscoriae]|uniref:PfkB family carbohydrate kinase n=1 Tax=Nocardioides rubriscoriae TaxID=642762 RepID=UPI0011DF0ED2|nr:PfkB family carbohydrate kinase [Nocardioides rubriscoriae]